MTSMVKRAIERTERRMNNKKKGMALMRSMRTISELSSEMEKENKRWLPNSPRCLYVSKFKAKKTNHHHQRSPPFPLVFHPLELMITHNVRLLPLQSCFRLPFLLFLLPESGRREEVIQTARRASDTTSKRESSRERTLRYHNSVWGFQQQMRNKHDINTVLMFLQQTRMAEITRGHMQTQ